MEKNHKHGAVSPLTPASSNPHVQNKIAQALARGPVLPRSRGASGMLSLWGKEAGRGGRDPSKIPIKNPPDEHELQGGVGFYHDQWKQVTLRVKNPKFTPVQLPSYLPRPGALQLPRSCQLDSLPAGKQKGNPNQAICFSICAGWLFKSPPAERFGAGSRRSLDNWRAGGSQRLLLKQSRKQLKAAGRANGS